MAAVEINTVANFVYLHNFPQVNLKNNNIQGLTAKCIKKLSPNTILMSPPCQPFSRNGNFGDIGDNRTDAFKHVCELLRLGELPEIEFVLMENVKGFENSKARELYLAALKEANFFYQEFIISPTQIGIPNSRSRYYCIARKHEPFSFSSDSIVRKFESFTNIKCLNSFIFSSTIYPTSMRLSIFHKFRAF